MRTLLVEFGMGSSLRRGDYTQAAKRAVQDALWHNSINLAELFGFEKTDMQIRLDVGVQVPDAVDADALKAVFPYGDVDVHVTKGGLDVPRPEGEGNPTIMANVALSVGFAMEKSDG
ncbi:Lin0512 family protein [Sulfitobacter aestuariivivens]|uniref:Lin0512 family protein n=1 Tax=Sulfitobacter aestuariivivens TaxID=2766981 RepID=A0A927D5C5_9RHOB|nr:Lin0512 family protein [Sulfitobacter aestuariivivens]MBD3663537.1 Lin0512 family protein [Sulfitobacter aestuariivivens]